MFRYSRTVTVRNGASVAPALQAAFALTAHINKEYGLQMKVGTELFGELKIHWHSDSDSLDAMPKFAMRAAQDKTYAELLEQMKPFVVEGSVRDHVVQIFG